MRFYGGADPLIASPFLFASAAAVALGAKGVAASAIWRERGGDDQDIAIDIRRAFQRFSGFADGRWEAVRVVRQIGQAVGARASEFRREVVAPAT